MKCLYECKQSRYRRKGFYDCLSLLTEPTTRDPTKPLCTPPAIRVRFAVLLTPSTPCTRRFTITVFFRGARWQFEEAEAGFVEEVLTLLQEEVEALMLVEGEFEIAVVFVAFAVELSDGPLLVGVGL